MRQKSRKRRLRKRTKEQLRRIEERQHKKLMKNTKSERIKRWFKNIDREAM
jgi:hypothetical protein